MNGDTKVIDVLTQEVVSLGGDASDINLVVQDAYLRQQMAQAIAEVGQRGRNAVILEINHSLTRKQLVKELNCDWVDSDFTEDNVPLPVADRKEEVAVELLHLGRNVSDEEATKQAKQRGYRRATPREVLALGAKNPDLQRQFPIVAAPTGRGVLCFRGSAFERYLCVDSAEDDWYARCRFAVVREQLTP